MENKVKFYKGVQGIKQVYEMSLGAKKIDIICLSSQYAQVLGDWFDTNYQPKLAGSGIITREILPSIAGNSSTGAQKVSPNQVKFLPADSVNESDLLIFEGQLALISFDQDNPMAIVIAEEKLVRAAQIAYDALWNSIK